MPEMTESEWREFLSAGTRTGKVATTGRDGRPHVVPIWFVLDGHEVRRFAEKPITSAASL